MPISSQQGPLTAADLQEIWVSAVDPSYSEPFLLAGEGNGFEVYTQAFQQGERLSEAIDYTTQALYILPWSGQSGEPAAGEAYAQVELTFTRAGYTGLPMVLLAGTIYVDEVQNDFGPTGPVPTNTGRRYVLLEDLVFPPGEQGPLTVLAQAAKPGYGYNNPLPGSITFVENDGTGLYHDLGTVTVQAGTLPGGPLVQAFGFTMTAYNETDMPVPSNVGQYMYFTAGANAGIAALITNFISPNVPSVVPPSGSAVQLMPIVVVESFTTSGTFQENEPINLYNASAVLVGVGKFLGDTPAGPNQRIAFNLVQTTTGDASTVASLVGTISGATATADVLLYQTILTAEAPSGVPLAGGATWRIMDWATDWQLVCTNVESPIGGALGMLDLIGAERNIPRQPNEADVLYRERLATVADVVSPNAIKRALYRTLVEIPWCYRETINGLLPGFFYDRGVDPGAGVFSNGDPNGDFYDDDMLLWQGAVASGTFYVGDPVQYLRQVPSGSGPWLIQATGIYGGVIGGSTMEFIRKTGQAIEPVSGDMIVDTRTGAVFTPTASIANDFAQLRAWNVYLDYGTFRAYFVVEVAPLGFGEFGFAYDDSPFGGYDLPAPYLDFYDGYPYENSEVYLPAYAAVNNARAGGVDFDFFLSTGPCI